jgi:hypothetical protein
MNGLPALAENLAAHGRNGDSMLVHMTPGEVRGLQAIAEHYGTSLTTNPDTGMPEAFSLRNLLPMIAGIALTPIMGPMGAALAVGGVETVRTGDIGQGLMAGLGAYGGASLGAGLGAAGAQTAATAAPGVTEAMTVGSIPPPLSTAAPQVTLAQSTPSLVAPTATPLPSGIERTLQASFPAPGSQTGSLLTVNPITTASTMGANIPSATSFDAMGQGFKALGTEPGRAAFMSNIGGYGGLAKSAGMAAAPLLQTEPAEFPEPDDPYANYKGPYTPSARQVSYPDEDFRRRRTSEFMYFNPSNPVPFQEGGDVVSSINVTPAEADVYRNIANVQRLAGIPSIANIPLMVAPQRDMSSLVYNPVQYVPSETPRGEQNYGFANFAPRLDEAERAATGQGVSFFGPKTGMGNLSERLQRFGAQKPSSKPTPLDPAEYQAYTPADRVDMADYYYDPSLGGFVEKYKEPSNFFKNGGVPMLEDGGFVLTKQAVDGLGKGDNKEGQKVANRGLGAIPIKGPGHGTSDSIRTTIEGKQPALVSNGEAYVPKKQVEKNGGAKRFYALMRAAERRA